MCCARIEGSPLTICSYVLLWQFSFPLLGIHWMAKKEIPDMLVVLSFFLVTVYFFSGGHPIGDCHWAAAKVGKMKPGNNCRGEIYFPYLIGGGGCCAARLQQGFHLSHCISSLGKDSRHVGYYYYYSFKEFGRGSRSQVLWHTANHNLERDKYYNFLGYRWNLDWGKIDFAFWLHFRHFFPKSLLAFL